MLRVFAFPSGTFFLETTGSLFDSCKTLHIHIYYTIKNDAEKCPVLCVCHIDPKREALFF